MKKLLVFSFLAISVLACDDDDERASIIGSWNGDQAFVVVKYRDLPFYKDDRQEFNVTITFNEDGTVVLVDKDDGTTSTGNYTLTGDDLTVDIDFKLFELTGPIEFDVDRLTNQRLELSLDEDLPYNHPEWGTIVVDVEGHLHFDRN